MELLERRVITASAPEQRLIEDLKSQLVEYLKKTAHSISQSAKGTILRYVDDNILLLKYIRGRKGDVQKACDSIIRYAQVSSDMYPDLFPAKIPERARLVFELKLISVLRQPDDDGRIIVTFTCAGWDPKSISMNDVITAGRVLADWLLEFPSFFEKGVIMILNAEGVKFSQARQFTIPAMMRFMNVFWRSYPIRLKGVYYVNCPQIVNHVFSLLKPFFPKKLTGRVHIFSGLGELGNVVPNGILPASLGGSLSDEEALMPLSFLEE